MDYRPPALTDLGSIADHTFQTPGKGTKSTNTSFKTDKFCEFSHSTGDDECGAHKPNK
jgi:hypothetical protein